MRNFQMVINVFRVLCRRSWRGWKNYVSILWGSVLIYGYALKFKSLAVISGEKCAPWILPHIFMNYDASVLFFLLGIVMMFSNMPFVEPGTNSFIIRSGRKNWFWGSVLYLAIQSLLYVLIISLLSVMFLLPEVKWITSWGKLIGTLAQTNYGSKASLVQLNYGLITKFTPWYVMTMQIVLMWMIAFFTGCIEFCFNQMSTQGLGVVFASLIAVTTLLPRKMFGATIAFFLAPATWIDMSVFLLKDNIMYPSKKYIFMVLIIGSILFLFVSRNHFLHNDLKEEKHK